MRLRTVAAPRKRLKILLVPEVEGFRISGTCLLTVLWELGGSSTGTWRQQENEELDRELSPFPFFHYGTEHHFF